jgi:hypothetical protein
MLWRVMVGGVWLASVPLLARPAAPRREAIVAPMHPRFRRRRRNDEGPTLDDIYQTYGRVMQQAQLMEQLVRGHARQTEFVSLRVMGSSSKVIPQIERIDGKTIGWVKKRYQLPEDAEGLIALGLKVRNEMAHEFFDSIATRPPKTAGSKPSTGS